MRLIRFVVFCVFFAVGAGAMAVSILAGEIHSYYTNQQAVARVKNQTRRAEEMIQDYDAQIEHIREDPNLLGRLRPVMFGETPEAEDTAFPTGRDDRISEVSRQVAGSMHPRTEMPEIPVWVERCVQAEQRQALFVAGSGLLFVTLIFFGNGKARSRT